MLIMFVLCGLLRPRQTPDTQIVCTECYRVCLSRHRYICNKFTQICNFLINSHTNSDIGSKIEFPSIFIIISVYTFQFDILTVQGQRQDLDKECGAGPHMDPFLLAELTLLSYFPFIDSPRSLSCL